MKLVNCKSPLTIQWPTVPLSKGDLLWHQHHLLTFNLPGVDHALQKVQGLLISSHVGYAAVEMRTDR